LPSPKIPDGAWERRHELLHGEWKLYELYCSHRNDKTGQCDPSLKLLAEEMKRTYTHVSDLKRELILKGWLRRTGRNSVELLVGFLPPVVRGIDDARSSEKSEDGVRKNPKIAAGQSSEKSELRAQPSEKSEDGVRKNPNENSLPPDPPIRNELLVAEAAAAAAAESLRLPVDDRFVQEVITSGVYREDFVRWVWGKLKLHCMAGGSVPVRKQFLHWLKEETGAPPVQPVLPGMGAPVVAGGFGAKEPARPSLRAADPNCRLCAGGGEVEGRACPCRNCSYCGGTGMEVQPGKGARRCRCVLPPAVAQMSDEETAREQHDYEEARATLRQVNSS